MRKELRSRLDSYNDFIVKEGKSKNLLCDFNKSVGSYLYNKLDGKLYLDFCSFYGSNSLGFSHPSMNDKKFEKRLLDTAKYKPCNTEFDSLAYIDFIETFKRICMKDYKYLFVIEGGTQGVDSALKCAIDWKKNKYGENKALYDPIIVYMEHSFHGRGGYATTMTNTHDLNCTNNYPRFGGWEKITHSCRKPYGYRKGPCDVFRWDLDEWTKQSIDGVFKRNKGEIAGVFVEPLQSAGGNIIVSPEVISYIKKKCVEEDCLMIFDEVQTGIGMSGKMWMAEMVKEAMPDIICFGKKTQICGFIASTKIDEAKKNVFNTASRLGSTWFGSLTDMVRVSQVLKTIEKERLVDNAKERGAELLKVIKDLETTYPEIISEPRGVGLLLAFNVPDKQLFMEYCFKNKLIVFGCGRNGIRLRPPLTVSSADIGCFNEKIRKITTDFINHK